MFGRSKAREFKCIKEKLVVRINGWNKRLLSQAGRGVLIQAIGLTVPLYAMSYFLLPRGFIHEINMILAGYWWGDCGSKKKVHWKAWDSLCCSKLDGGLGFKDFESFNLALLAKTWWRIIHNENSLCHKVLKARYFPKVSPNQATRCANASYL